jgi:hypothetical protein
MRKEGHDVANSVPNRLAVASLNVSATQDVRYIHLTRYWKDLVITDEPSGLTKTGAFLRPGPH